MRSAIVAAVIAKLGTLNLGPGVTVAEHSGDDVLFNEDAVFPLVGVAYAGGRFEPSQEYGAITYRAEYGLEIAVTTKDTVDDDRDGHTQATALLDAIEAGLHGAELAGVEGGAVAELQAEELVEAWQGRFLYVQTYRIRLFVSRQT